MYSVRDQLYQKLVDYVVRLSGRLHIQCTERTNQEIKASLAELGRIFEYDRAFLFRYSEETKGFHCIFKWYDKNINNESLQENIYRTEYPWVSRKFRESKNIIIPSVENLSDKASKLRERLLKNNIVSSIFVPITTDIGPYGFIVLDSLTKKIAPNEQESSILSIVGSLFGNTLIRQQYNKRYEDVLGKLNKITTSMSDFICQTDLDFKICYLSPSIENFLGYIPDELTGKLIYEFIHPEDIENVKRLELIVQNKLCHDRRLDCRLRNKYGEYIWVEGVSELIYDNEEVNGVILNIRNITKRKHLEKKLKDSNKKLEDMTEKLRISNESLQQSQKLLKVNFEKASIGMIIIDLKSNHYKVNQSMVDILGYSKEELKNMNIYTITHPDDIEKEKKIFDQICRGEIDSANYEKRYFSKNGELVWANLNVVLIRDNNGDYQYLLTHVEDVSDVKRQEQIISQQEEELKFNLLRTQFFANLSHELKTPLNLVFSALQILTRSLHKNNIHEEDRYLNIIRQNSMRLLRLVNNVIDMTKINVNSFEVNFSSYNIINIVKKIVESTESYVIEKNRKIKFYSDVEEKIIKCDPFSIERIFLNLISNAIKFTDEGDEINVRISDQGNNVLVSVRDTGIGIKEDKKDIVFDLFRQADESFSRRAEGSGIGLAIVKSLVDLHGGEIYLKSKYGEGTEFFVSLPVENKSCSSPQSLYEPDYLIDKIDVEFSDIYDL
ncbi:MAG: PAS domain S-box protein [bacterium]